MARAEEYAKLHREFLKEQAPDTYNALKESGELVAYLTRVGQQAVDLYDTLEAQMIVAKDLQQEPDYHKKVERMEQIPHIVLEIVMTEVVYNRAP